MIELPQRIILEVTAHCNFRCPFCYCVWHEFPELACPELDIDSWKEIIRECAKRGVTTIIFSGGEATTRNDIWELLDFARARIPLGTISLFTNGSLMTDTRIKWCKKRWINLDTSLQGLKTFGKQTGTRRTCEKTLSFIAKCAELQWPADVSITVSKINLHEIDDVYLAALRSRAHAIQLNPTMVEGKSRSCPDIALTPAEWKEVKDRIKKIPDRDIPRWFSDEIICDCRQQPPSFQHLFANSSMEPCQAGKSFGVIGPSGLFRKCLHTVENLEWR
ncbi:MAG: radical SAM protein [Victivallales bacterium]|nr:radical SAM protein [Victivallales bacterium]